MVRLGAPQGASSDIGASDSFQSWRWVGRLALDAVGCCSARRVVPRTASLDCARNGRGDLEGCSPSRTLVSRPRPSVLPMAALPCLMGDSGPAGTGAGAGVSVAGPPVSRGAIPKGFPGGWSGASGLAGTGCWLLSLMLSMSSFVWLHCFFQRDVDMVITRREKRKV